MQNKTRTKIKTTIFTIVVCLLMLFTASSFTSCAFLDYVSDKLDDAIDNLADNDNNVTDTDGNSLVSGFEYILPQSLIFETPSHESNTAANGISVKVETIPIDAANKQVDWAVAFVDPSSDWAIGKTASSYIRVTPSNNDSLTATVKCLAAFGEQIKVVAKLRSNPAITIECTADYVSNCEGFTITSVFPQVSATSFSSHTLNRYPYIYNSSSYEEFRQIHSECGYKIKFNFGLGTLKPAINIGELAAWFNQDFAAALVGNLAEDLQVQRGDINYTWLDDATIFFSLFDTILAMGNDCLPSKTTPEEVYLHLATAGPNNFFNFSVFFSCEIGSKVYNVEMFMYPQPQGFNNN